MIKKWISWFNYGMCGLIALLLISALYYFFGRTTDFPTSSMDVRKPLVPKNSFVQQKEKYDAIGEPALSLTFSPLSLQLPDLKRYLSFYGRNGRPDAKDENPALYFAFNGNKTPFSVSPGERLYVVYDKRQNPPQYVFSQNNAVTPLWIEARIQGNIAVVTEGMTTDTENEDKEKSTTTSFSLPEKELSKTGGPVWELGKLRVDGTLLARQKARWFGVDKFLERHGGDEFKEQQNKQRIDIGEGDKIYSVYVGLGDCLIWDKDEKWKVAEPGPSTLDKPLMCVKKIDDRVMNLELWDVDGKGKITLNLIKAHEQWQPKNLEQGFKFIGARTRSQYIFEINNERMTLSPHDWLVFTSTGWKKLESAQDIDDYVERRLIGPLFVFDDVEKKDEKQVITGVLFNAGRTETVSVEIPLQQTNSGLQGKKKDTEEPKPQPQHQPIPPQLPPNLPPVAREIPIRDLKELQERIPMMGNPKDRVPVQPRDQGEANEEEN